jgi:hypothetical protein
MDRSSSCERGQTVGDKDVPVFTPGVSDVASSALNSAISTLDGISEVTLCKMALKPCRNLVSIEGSADNGLMCRHHCNYLARSTC